MSTQQYLTVSALSTSIQTVMGQAFSNVYVRGEISSLKVHTSGHIYLTLKDEKSVIDAIIWRGTALKLQHKAEEGLEILSYGRVTTYPARSKYQLIIESFEPAGIGALLKLLEERKERLRQEGLFALERKKPLPFLPRIIGVITSETGAVIRDILHRLEDRFPVHVYLCPVAVQGESCPSEVKRALSAFLTLPDALPKPDVVIVARGGGSLEDLWGFNDESLARMVAEYPLPVISAVGHETDTTLIDYVADRRAPTPTAAAEMAVPVRVDLLATIEVLERRLKGHLRAQLEQKKLTLKSLTHRLVHPKQFLEWQSQKLDEVFERLTLYMRQHLQKTQWHLKSLYQGLITPKQVIERSTLRLAMLEQRLQALTPRHLLETQREKLQRLTEELGYYTQDTLKTKAEKLKRSEDMLHSLSPFRTLKRGYTLVSDPSGQKIYGSAQKISSKDKISIHFHDGKVTAEVE